MTSVHPPAADSATLAAAFVLVFRQGRAPPSCPVPDDEGLLNRIRDTVLSATPRECRDALIRVRRLSFDVTEICTAFRNGEYGGGEGAKAAALSDLEDRNPGFTDAGYLTAFSVGLMWAGL